jgi:lipopolysaccharide biosynthesis regulator YciM
LLLLAQAQPQKAEQILGALPNCDTELLLRAQVALTHKEERLAAAILDAAQDRESIRWHFLRGQAALGQEDYRTAADCFHRVEESGETSVYSWLEQCYQRLEDYKMAYHYACKQK